MQGKGNRSGQLRKTGARKTNEKAEGKMAQEIFERYEKKYLLDTETYLKLIQQLVKYMEADAYGKYAISNIYFDTEDFKLIRTSLQGPVYKEKMRLRSYGTPGDDSLVFAEIKKKYAGVVYKRRVPLCYRDAVRYLYSGIRPDTSCMEFTERQIMKEIDYMKEQNALRPAAFISYDRMAFAGKENPELRVTFDNNILCRMTDLKLDRGRDGINILESGMILMEIKIPQTVPLWMSHLMEQVMHCQTSFSKYGEFYKLMTEQDNKEGGKICA